MKKQLVVFVLVALVAFLIPIEHKYDKLFRFFSKTLIPQGLELSKNYDKKIYFYISDLIAISLVLIGLFWQKISIKRFFASPLWIVFLCALASIIASPFIHYPVAYTRLLQLFTPIALFSFLANSDPKMSRLIMVTFVVAGLCQTAIAIMQYFNQAPLGLRILGEANHLCTLSVPGGKRWIFDSAHDLNHIFRASATMGHPNVLGGFFLVSILCTYFLSTKHWIWNLTLPFQFFALCVTYSRSALFGTILATGIWLLQKRDRMVMLMMGVSFILCSVLLYEQFVHRGGVVNYHSGARDSDAIRLFHQKTAFDIIQDHPIFGLGYNQFSERAVDYLSVGPEVVKQTAPHNIYLFLSTETGLISLAAFLLFIAMLLHSLLRTSITPETATLSAIFIAFLFIGLCDFYPLLFQSGKLMFFLIAGLLASHVQYVKKRENLSYARGLMSNPERREVWKMFDLISSTYDRINRILSFGMDKKWRATVAKHLPSKKNLKILDLATGTGDQIIALLKAQASIQSITGIDLSAEMLAIAKKKLPESVSLIRADAEKLPFAENTFDAATFSFGIRNVTDPLTSLKSLYRVLKPSGRCLILEFSLPPQPIRFFYLFYLRHILTRLGGALSKNREAYRYLNQTIEHFPSGKEFGYLMRDAGFTRLSAVPMALGGVTLYIGEKE